MRKVILLFCALVCANVLMAHQQLATLNHNDSIRVFYGTNAFVQAYNAAVDGDVITLSDGAFSTCDINKGITVRGNGAYPDTARNSFGTQFLETLIVQATGTSGRFEAEGIYFPDLRLHNNSRSKIVKCVVNDFSTTNHGSASVEAINCILNRAGISANDTTTSMYINCVVNVDYYLPNNASFTNCIVKGLSYNNASSQYSNCIVVRSSNNYNNYLQGYGYNNILCGFTSLSGIYSQEQGNVVMNVSDVFETWDGGNLIFKDDAYTLKDSVATHILGLDGTQVGVYGGMAPLGLTPPYCIIKKCDVATRTNAEGKLSVDIEVETETE